jgi:hypothetical protein
VSTAMSDVQFWELVERVPEPDRVNGRLADALAAELARLPIPRIAGFQRTLLAKLEELLAWPVWEAADVIHREPCSEDCFLYFRLWIVSQGGSVFSAAVADPDSLALHPSIPPLSRKEPGKWADADFPHMDDLLYGAQIAFDMVLAKLRPEVAAGIERPADLDERPREVPRAAMPADFGDGLAVRDRLPRLIELFSYV